MNSLSSRVARVLFLASMLTFIGCGANSPPAKNTSSEAHGHSGQAEHSQTGHDHGAATGNPMDEMKAALAGLSPADAAAAERQHFCPVSGEMLGTMGAPEKVEVEGQEVWICCEACRERLLADPASYLAKINYK